MVLRLSTINFKKKKNLTLFNSMREKCEKPPKIKENEMKMCFINIVWYSRNFKEIPALISKFETFLQHAKKMIKNTKSEKKKRLKFWSFKMLCYFCSFEGHFYSMRVKCENPPKHAKTHINSCFVKFWQLYSQIMNLEKSIACYKCTNNTIHEKLFKMLIHRYFYENFYGFPNLIFQNC